MGRRRDLVKTLFRTALIFWALLVAGLRCAAEVPAFPFAGATIDGLQSRMASGKLSARELTAAYLTRIAQIDQAGPSLHAVIEVNPDALEIAVRLDAERKAGRVRGPLHGIPVLIKDNIATLDRMETTAGSLALVGARPMHDAFIVARLREAGAVILGKTNLSEWANFRARSSTSGWSARGGLTRNPYVLDRNPSGSSSGSAVAVAADLCVVAVGTETDGSIVSPSSVCGIVGMKPTVGLVSRAGIIPIAASQDTAGPMARTVRDAAILLGVLAGVDPHDAVTETRPSDLPGNFVPGLVAEGLKGARIGIVRGPFGFQPRVDAVMNDVVATLRAAGAEVVDPINLPVVAQLAVPETEVLLYEFKAGLNGWFTSLGANATVRSVAELIAFNEAHRTQELPFFSQELLVRAQAKGPLTEKAYRDARELCLKLARIDGIDAAVDAHRIDALVAITNGPAAPTDLVNGDRGTGSSSTLAAVAGYPSVTVPAAQMSGLPVGVSFFGRAWSEAELLAFASDFETRTHARRAPNFSPTIEIR